MNQDTKTNGEIITFYSYKGGTGRTLALANIGCLLATRWPSEQVLMVDWDLEAPGLHRYFRDHFRTTLLSPLSRQKSIDDHEGLLDLFLEVDRQSAKLSSCSGDAAVKSAQSIYQSINLDRYIMETDISGLHLMKAGRFSPGYANKVNSFNWTSLFSRSEWLVRLFADTLKERYRFILIDYCFELKHAQMTALFPAVAIMDRVVMLPEEFHVCLDVHPRTFLSLARPLDLAGVEFVDFSSEEILKHAVHRVAMQLKAEWRNLCHRHMGIRQLFRPDYKELARLLDVNQKILAAQNLYSPDVRLEASVVSANAREGVLSPVVIEVRNTGGRELRRIRVRVRAPSNVMSAPITKVCDLLPPEAIRIEMKLTPKVAPCCPLEVFIDHGDEPLEIPSFPIPVLLDVLP